jgi:hypothetical protein
MGRTCSMHGEMNEYWILVGKLEGKRPMGRPRRRFLSPLLPCTDSGCNWIVFMPLHYRGWLSGALTHKSGCKQVISCLITETRPQLQFALWRYKLTHWGTAELHVAQHPVRVHCRDHKTRNFYWISDQLKWVHIFTCHLSKIHSNIIKYLWALIWYIHRI